MENKDVSQLPDQMISTRKKGKEWREKCVKYYSDYTNIGRSRKRKSFKTMRDYWRVVYGQLNDEDMRETFDPLGVNRDDDSTMPEHTVAYNPIKKGLRTLWNEERKRKNEVKPIAINPELINAKDMEFKERFLGYMAELEKQYQEGYQVDDETIKKALSEITYWKKHDLQTAHEAMAGQLLNYFTKTPNKRYADIRNKAFQNLSVIGEEILSVETHGDEPMIKKVNSEQFEVIGLGNSDYIEDAEAWVEWEHLPKHRVIEMLGGKITKKEMESIDEITSSSSNYSQYELARVNGGQDDWQDLSMGKEVGFGVERSTEGIGGKWVNEDGDILVTRVTWVSQRRLQKVTTVDSDGNESIVWHDENYEPDEALGEDSEDIWVDEIWQGLRIGENLFKNIEPMEMQMRSITNPAVVRPPYVGTILTYGDNNHASSVMDELIPLKRDFDLWANKLRKLWSQHKGNILRVSKSMIPKDMDETEWFRWMNTLGILFEDDFNADPTFNTLAGNMQGRTPVINLSVAQDINAAIQMLTYIQSRIDSILSTPPSRTGELQGNEGLGVTQQSLMGATLSTEDLYAKHEDTLVRFNELLLEYTKVLWKGKHITKQYLMDDMSQYILEYDGDKMQEAECAVVLTNSSELQDIQRDLDMYGHDFAQNGSINFSDLFKLRTASSISEAVKRLEAAEDKKREEQQMLQQQQAEQAKEIEQLRIQSQERLHQMEMDKIRLKGEMDLQREQVRFQLQATVSTDENGDGVEDDVEIKVETIKAEATKSIERLRLQFDERKHKDEVRLKEEELRIKEIAAKKPAPKRN